MSNSADKRRLAPALGSCSPAIPERLRRPIIDLLPAGQLFPGFETEVRTDAPLRVKWECVRAALDSNSPVQRMFPIPQGFWDDYDSLWEHLDRKTPEGQSQLRLRVSPEAWENAVTPSGTIVLRGSLTLNGDKKDLCFISQLDPICQEGDGRSCRFARRFGGDRFLTMTIFLGARASQNVRDHLSAWLKGAKTFLGRTWHTLFVRDKKPGPNCYEVKFFATAGGDLSPTPLDCVVQWLIPLSDEANKRVPACKLYSRIGLGFSKTYPTVAFSPDCIDEVDDEYGDETEEDSRHNDRDLDWTLFTEQLRASSRGRVMNDGCARISVEAANALWKSFDSPDPVPSVFQGRIGNAKGVWVKSIDPEKDARNRTWIETTTSQRKFQRHEEDGDEASYDKHRTTFDLLAWSSQLASSHLSVSLLSVLRDRGVSESSITQFVCAQMDLEKDLFFNALDDPISLLKWTSDRFPNTSPDGDLAVFQASMPKLRLERIARLLKAGFEPRTCSYLSWLIKKGVTDWLNRLGEKLEVRVPRSTSAFGVADFQRVLRPGEIFLSFSRALTDAQLPCLHDREVLVARYPIHRHSDVQKVRAVYYPELASIQDVVVFSTRGSFPLAEKLSNGDYDGDRYWICWEPLLVEEFKNAPPPTPIDAEGLGIRVASESFLDMDGIHGFLEKSIDFQLSEKILGLCASYQDKYAYRVNALSTPEMARLSDLRDHLVDAPKNGYQFSMGAWNRFLTHGRYPQYLSDPAYKTSIHKVTTYKKDNIVDHVKFAVMSERLRDFKTEAEARLARRSSEDEHPSSLYRTRYRNACAEANHEIREEIERLVDNLDDLVRDWRKREFSLKHYDDDIERAYARFQNISPQNTAHSAIGEWMGSPLQHGFAFWDLLKASALYSKFMNEAMAHFVFSMAGRELLFMKAFSVDPDAQFVVSDVMSILRVKRRKDIRRKL